MNCKNNNKDFCKSFYVDKIGKPHIEAFMKTHWPYLFTCLDWFHPSTFSLFLLGNMKKTFIYDKISFIYVFAQG